ncbi:MAG: DUF2461 domain-containing protein [Ginsengibacter sp.]
MFQQSTLNFLRHLAKNNNKIWLDENRDSYLNAKNDFENFISLLIKRLSTFDADIKELQVKDCTFRLNRDIRFSKDKTPYKINMGASLNRGGKKSLYAGYYFHLEPGNKSFAGGGLWMPMAPELKKLRQEIDYNFDEFVGILNNKKFITHYAALEMTEDVKLINLPRGYKKTNPAADYVKLKSFIATKPISDIELIDPSLLNKTSKPFEALMPFVKFLNKALE